MNLNTERIRALNDELRRNLPNGHAVMTAGVAALGPEAVARIVKTIAVYDDFCQANDPYQEHDFGSFDADGHVIFFKIDYFDKALTVTRPTRRIRRSPSASSPSCWLKNTDAADAAPSGTNKMTVHGASTGLTTTTLESYRYGCAD